ncbi:ABC transporter ATP-binding protein [Alkalihalobacterium elongatum]|uniref:ABC transporter ATP-binding protein n=1 Tax=Alkalihalobacterium elongatum TaxID=2675466 RepID=UPI001C1F600A|nr:ABC transporter ATP-binding protein [Alkalihalobacterium elongatum]
MTPGIETKQLSIGYSENLIIENLDMKIPKGKITVLIGSNGCGKSTLLRSLARLLKPKSGNILLNQEKLNTLSTKEIAKQLSILPQGPTPPDGITVLQLVKQGRYPYQSWRKQWSEEDERIVKRALEVTNLEDLINKQVDSLSGGQRQRVWIAMTLAQATETILLDEPTTYLDLSHQIEILDLLFELNANENRTVIMVLHDINLACRYAHHLIAIKDKTIYAEGSPHEIINESLIEDVFNLKCQIINDPLFHTPMCIPYGKVVPFAKTATGTFS